MEAQDRGVLNRKREGGLMALLDGKHSEAEHIRNSKTLSMFAWIKGLHGQARHTTHREQ